MIKISLNIFFVILAISCHNNDEAKYKNVNLGYYSIEFPSNWKKMTLNKSQFICITPEKDTIHINLKPKTAMFELPLRTIEKSDSIFLIDSKDTTRLKFVAIKSEFSHDAILDHDFDGILVDGSKAIITFPKVSGIGTTELYIVNDEKEVNKKLSIYGENLTESNEIKLKKAFKTITKNKIAQ
ncbi:MAG: hypothetical protein Q8K02_16670 [Flavobacterium sp.]|nr:hypothetical protein [Flavobacterium sp.]